MSESSQSDQTPPNSHGEFTRAVVRGARWSGIGVVLVTVLQVARVIILGRILGPEPFGILAMMMVFVMLGELAVQFGLGEAIIQHHDPTVEQRSTLFWITAGLGILGFVLLALMSPIIATLYSTPELVSYLPWLATVLIISPWAAQIRALLQKNLEFAGQSMVEALAIAAGLMAATALALYDYGVWSLVVGQLVQSLCQSLALLLLGFRHRLLPRLVFDFAESLPLLRFGVKMMFSNLAGLANARVDQLLVGSLLGAQSLGYYVMAFNLVVQPFMKIGAVVGQLAFPALSKISHDVPRVKKAYFRMLGLLSTFNAPLLIGAAIVAPGFVVLTLGDSWLPAIPVIQVMAIFSLFRSINASGASLVLSLGRAGRVLIWNLGLLLVVPASLALGIYMGDALGAAIALLLVQLVVVFAWYLVCVRPLIGASLMSYLGAMAPALATGTAMAVAILLILGFLPDTAGWPKMMLQIGIGAAVYLVLTWSVRRQFVRQTLALLRDRE